MASRVQEIYGVQVTLTPGATGEFSIWVNGARVAQKDSQGFPPPDEVVARIGQQLQAK